MARADQLHIGPDSADAHGGLSGRRPFWTESRFGKQAGIAVPSGNADPWPPTPSPSPRIAELAELIDDFLASQLSPRTRESYAGDLVIFLQLARRPRQAPARVARPDVDRYRNWLAEPIGPDGKPAANGRPRYAPATVARKLSAVRAFYNYLSERRVIPGSPAAGVKGPRLRREPRGRAITDEQVRGCSPSRPSAATRPRRSSACSCSTACACRRSAPPTSSTCGASPAAATRWSCAARAARRSRSPSTSAPSAPS